MLYILIPVFNEAENIPNLYNDLKDIIPEQKKLIVFSDDGSSDNSIKVIEKLFKDIPHHIISNLSNHGPGNAFNVGFEWILLDSSDDNDIVITLEADSTSDISLLPKMIAINNLGYNLILSSVYAQGGGFEGTTFYRKLISSIANLTFRFLFDIKTLTLSSFYRLYSVDLLRRIKVNNANLIISEKGFISMLEILVKSIHQKANIIEIPMTLHSKKRNGKSKMKIIKTFLEYVKFFLKMRKYKKNNPTIS